MKKSIVSAALLIPALAFAADRLNVKTGLWEITTLTATQGIPELPAEVKGKMTPEQRAKLAAVFQSSAASPHRNVSKECITEKDLEQPFKPNDDGNCTSTVVKSTGTSQEINVSCTGEHASSGKMRISTPTSESMTGDLEFQAGNGGEMTIKTQIKGRWLGASCKGAAD